MSQLHVECLVNQTVVIIEIKLNPLKNTFSFTHFQLCLMKKLTTF